MSRIISCELSEYPEALRDAANGSTDLVVIRDALSAEELAAFDTNAPQSNEITQRLMTWHGDADNIPGTRREPSIDQALGGLVVEHAAPLGEIAKVTVDIGEGGLMRHADKPDLALSASLTLNPATFWAERVAEHDAPFEDIKQGLFGLMATGRYLRTRVDMIPGDLVLVSRGVVHEVEAAKQRKTLLVATYTTQCP